MNLGQICIFVAFFASAGAACFFYINGMRSARVKPPKASPLPGRLYLASLLASLLASGVLLSALLGHQFQYSYAAHYSSSELPVLYLVSSFWAGQEGTFLLWALMTGIMGYVFLKSSRTVDDHAMAIISAYAAFLYLLLIVKSPFEILTPAPPDGNGLNPLLQDPWMAIHPPILFAGYAATVFPFALALSALIRRNNERWINSGFAWSLFAAVLLGAGIIIGGFWAYEVLGWGGYWGWDPVENSSLVPWLILLALLHGLLIQKAKGAFLRTNIFLAIISFILVLYATFLTRSGVLADFSVHSFVDLGINNYLVGVMAVSTILGFGLFISRFKDLKSPKADLSGLHREFTLLLSIYVLCAGAAFTFFGMSSPILTGLIGKASQVDTSFYNKVNLPVAIGIGLLLGLTPFLGWTKEEFSVFIKRLSLPLALTLLSAVIAYVAGVNSPMLLLFVAMSVFALVSNTIVAFRMYRTGWLHMGGPVAHIGVALLFIGIVGSGKFDESKKVVLKSGEPQTVYGYQFTYKGVSGANSVKPSVNIEVSDGKNTFLATPKLYYSEYNKSLLREPHIKIMPLKDLYISPLEMRESAEPSRNPAFELVKGETKEMGGFTISFERFETGQHQETGNMLVGAILNMSVEGKAYQLIPRLSFNERGERAMMPADMPPINLPSGTVLKPRISLTAISVEEKKVILELLGFDQHMGSQPKEELIVDISTKPLMMVVWTGVVLIILGTAIAWRRRIAGV